MLDYKNPRLIIETNKVNPDKITWRSPSNIAIIKYWGKYGQQLPRNPSISFTLNNAYTETTLEYEPKKGTDRGIALEFFFEDQANEAFKNKIIKFLDSLGEIFPFLRQLNFIIRSRNSFPHSAGIASSASSMSALALCLCTLEDHLFGTLSSDEDFRKKASFIARLGSGSACRSIFATMGIWGESGEIDGSSNLFAIPYENKIHQDFKTFHDDILLISTDEKSVSSRAGHALMDNNIYADNRYSQARQRFHKLLISLQTGNLEEFGLITESEALTLHALMMTSNPPYLLMEPNSLIVINKIRAYRQETKNPIYFSLDAGPNIHVLYPDAIKDVVQKFIKEDLSQYCYNGRWISDQVGKGPLQL